MRAGEQMRALGSNDRKRQWRPSQPFVLEYAVVIRLTMSFPGCQRPGGTTNRRERALQRKEPYSMAKKRKAAKKSTAKKSTKKKAAKKSAKRSTKKKGAKKRSTKKRSTKRQPSSAPSTTPTSF
jgi:hypothetical protein